MKTLRESTHPRHKLIKALKAAGHTNIVVTINQAMDIGARGIYLDSDSAKYQYLGAQMDRVISKLNKT